MLGVYSLGRSERIWPFDDGATVAWADDDQDAARLMSEAGQGYDARLCRFVARLPGVCFPITLAAEHRAAVRMARALFAEHGAA